MAARADNRWDDDFERCIVFHGHVCPGLAIGYRAAKAGMEWLGEQRAEDEEIVCVHPVGPRLVGYAAVRSGWSCYAHPPTDANSASVGSLWSTARYAVFSGAPASLFRHRQSKSAMPSVRANS